jgi:hypothetical protein
MSFALVHFLHSRHRADVVTPCLGDRRDVLEHEAFRALPRNEFKANRQVRDRLDSASGTWI